MKKIIIPLSLVALVAACYYFFGRHEVKLKPKQQIGAPTTRTVALIKGPFKSVSDPDFEQQLKVRWKELTRTNRIPHASELLAKVIEFFRAFDAGTYDAYLKFKSCDLPYSFSVDGVVDATLRQEESKGTVIPSGADAKAQKFWGIVTKADSTGVGSRIIGVDLGKLGLLTNKVGKAQSAVLNVARMQAKSSMAMSAPNTLVKFQAHVQKELERNDVLVAIVGGPCITTRAEWPTYVHAGFVWSDSVQRWIPAAFVTDATVRFSVVF